MKKADFNHAFLCAFFCYWQVVRKYLYLRAVNL